MIYRFEDFTLDTDRYELRRGEDICAMEPQVFELLRLLVEHHDRLVPRDEIIDCIWPERYIGDAALSSRVMAARKVLGDSGTQQRLIKTIHGRGFRFVGDVTVATTPVRNVPADASPELPPASSRARPMPPVRYAVTADGISIAYAIEGDGPPLVRVPGWVTHLELESHWPASRAIWERLASHHRLIRYDGRGFGLSDPAEHFSVETRIADLEAVLAAAGVESAALLGTSASGVNTAVRFAALNPARVSHLVTYGGGVNVLDEAEHAAWVREWRMHIQVMKLGWGKDIPIYRELMAKLLLGLNARDEDIAAMTDLHRVASPGERAAHYIVTSNDDELPDLATRVQAPTLVTHRRDDPAIPLNRARRLAQLIPDARLLVLDGDSHLMLAGLPGTDEFLLAVEEFLGG